jgi:hypothetical protein
MLAKDPNSAEGHRILALGFWKDRQYENSLSECALALQTDPNSAAVLALQALNLWQLDRKKDTRRVLEEVARDPDLRANFANTGVFCRMVVCDGHDIGVVNDFLRRNRWVVYPDQP